MNNVILKYKAKYPIGSILKHKACNLMMKVVDYKFIPGNHNAYNILREEAVVVESIYSLINKCGDLSVFYVDVLDQYKIITEDECNNILNKLGLSTKSNDNKGDM